MLIVTQLNGFGGKNGDPLYQFVELLLPFEGADGATSTTDRSRDPKTVTFSGNAQLDTAIKKHGSSSLLLDGTGDYATVTDTAAFTLGTQDWTLEAWIYLLSAAGTGPSSMSIFNIDDDGDPNGLEINFRVSGTQLNTLVSSDGLTIDLNFSGGTISTNTWHHAVLQRNGSDFRIGLDGSSVANTTSSLTINHSGADPTIGRLDNGTNEFHGHIDDLRWTIGAARYSFPFTPPGPLPAF